MALSFAMIVKPAEISTPPRPQTNNFLVAWLSGPWPVVLLISGFLGLGLSAAMQKSPTFDEPVHIAGGHSYWAHNDYRMHPENGNWSERWVALPVWLSGYNLPPKDDESWKNGKLWDFAETYFYGQGNDPKRLIMLARWMQGVPAAALALIVYLWSRKLFGPLGGLISLTLCACSPTILGYGFYTTSEMGVTLFLLASTWAVWTLLHRVTPGTFAMAGFALSGVALTKFSGLAIIPIAGLLLWARMKNPTPWIVAFRGTREVSGRKPQLLFALRLAGLLILFVSLVIWASFGFKYSILGPDATASDHLDRSWESLHVSKVMRGLLMLARKMHLLPEGYLYGFKHVLATTRSRPSFLNGSFNMRGFRTYFAVCLALKTPLTLFLFMLLSAAGGWRRRDKNQTEQSGSWLQRQGVYELVPLFALWGYFMASALLSRMNIGHRLIMPLYPAMFVLAGGAAMWFPRNAFASTVGAKQAASSKDLAASASTSCIVRVVMFIGLLFTIAQSAWIWPNYTAFFNILGGGERHGYRHMVDSSVDWGQDFDGLREWLEAHPTESTDTDRVYVSYFGSIDYKRYRVEARWLPSHFNKASRLDEFYSGGLYCISATNLQSVYGPFPGRWNAKFEEQYQSLRPIANAYLELQNDPAAQESLAQEIGEENLTEALDTHEHLRFRRLCAFLRAREPDDNVGGSILIYRLKDEDVRQALAGPPVETLQSPEH